jgi:hypothetical protein
MRTLDLVITRANSSLHPVTTCIHTSSSGHLPVLSAINIAPSPLPPLSMHTYRSIKSTNVEKFKQDILSSSRTTHPATKLSDLVDCYQSTLSTLPDKYAHRKSKLTCLKPLNPWFTPALNKLKRACWCLHVRVWCKIHSGEDLKPLHSATNQYHAAIVKDKEITIPTSSHLIYQLS